MGYRRYHRNRWWGKYQAKYSELVSLFGPAVEDVRKAFMTMDGEDLDSLFGDYGEIYGESAERYARGAFGSWKNGSRRLSGQTLERLVELVPPYLSSSVRYEILQSVIKHNKPVGVNKTVRINIKEPSAGFVEAGNALASMDYSDLLAYLPEKVMKAATWLYANDVTAARAMLAQANRAENDLMRASAAREFELLRRTITSGQIKSASYSLSLPAGRLSLVAYDPSFCFVATVCCGPDAPETKVLRQWRDHYLVEQAWGRRFVVWYYANGERMAKLVQKSPLVKHSLRHLIKWFAIHISTKLSRSK